jgi:nitrous oxidase accessory protein NosD
MAAYSAPQRLGAVLGVMVLVGMVVVAVAPSASASSPPTCRVDNETQGTEFSSDTGQALTDAIVASVPGDQLVVIGTCTGNFAVDKNLTLTGISQKKFPTPTLDGNQVGTTLFIRNAAVALANLTITGGAAMDTPGGGILNNFGTLTLDHSTVSGNTTMGRTADGGGIFNNFGTARLDNSTVRGNSAVGTFGDGGGIFNNFGTTRLDNSTVSGNTASSSGGGIFNNSGTVTLVDSIVSGNIPDDCVNVPDC